MANGVELKGKGHLEKFWWAYLLGGLFMANLYLKGIVSKTILENCLSRGVGAVCTCVAGEATKRLGPVYLLYPLTGGGRDVEQVGEAVVRYCNVGQ